DTQLDAAPVELSRSELIVVVNLERESARIGAQTHVRRQREVPATGGPTRDQRRVGVGTRATAVHTIRHGGRAVVQVRVVNHGRVVDQRSGSDDLHFLVAPRRGVLEALVQVRGGGNAVLVAGRGRSRG